MAKLFIKFFFIELLTFKLEELTKKGINISLFIYKDRLFRTTLELCSLLI